MSEYSFEVNKYREGGRISVLIVGDDGPYSRLTINIPDVKLEKNEFIFNNSYTTYCKDLHSKLQSQGILEATGKWCQSGYQTYAIGKLLISPEKLSEEILVL